MARSYFRSRIVFFVLAAATLLGGCAGSYEPTSAKLAAEGAPQADLLADSAAGVALGESRGGVAAAEAAVVAIPASGGAETGAGPASGGTPARPYLIQTAEISLQVDDVAGQSAALQALAVEKGGYLANLTESSDPIGGTRVQMTLRIPAGQLGAALETIQAMGTVLQRTMSADDVTLQFVDMQSQLRNLQKMEERLLAHLERTGQMQDILNVEREVTRVRGEIETLQGRVNKLANQIDFATVQVRLAATPTAGPISPASDFSTIQTFTDAARNLLYFGRALWIVTIWVGVWTPVWVPTALLIRRLYRRRQDGSVTSG